MLSTWDGRSQGSQFEPSSFARHFSLTVSLSNCERGLEVEVEGLGIAVVLVTFFYAAVRLESMWWAHLFNVGINCYPVDKC